MVILLVHDDPAVMRELAAAMAAARPDFICLMAPTAETAATLANAREDDIDALIGGVQIGGVDGPGLATALRRRFPELKAAFLADGDLAAAAQQWPGQLLLPARPLPAGALVAWAVAVAPAVAKPPPRLGDYELLEIIGRSDEVVTHRALQCSVQRVVALEQLRPEHCANAATVASFRALVRAKAAVVHQHIAAVYEAQELDGAIFYTRELIDGRSLPELLHAGVRLKQDAVLSLLNAAAEAVSYFDAHRLPRGPLTPREVLQGRDGLPRVANVALGGPAPGRDERGEIMALMQAAHSVLDAAAPAPEFTHLLGRVRDPSPRGLHRWADFAQAVAIERQKAVDAQSLSTRKLSVGTYRIVMMRRRKKRYFYAAICVTAAILGGICLHYRPYFTAPRAHPFDEMAHIPAGKFIYQNGEERTLPEFWIDKFEVSLAQYAAFLQHIDDFHANYDDPRQPASKASHKPVDWDTCYRAALRGETYQGHHIDVNCPVMMVDFWDALAYARWKERRLPTEFEWEKAARGTDGRLYPWGRDPDPSKCNSGADYADNGDGGKIDGYSGWAPVDAHAAQDVSPFGVVGMAGNVCEWTSSQMLHPERLDQQVPVLRGGSFVTKPSDLTVRHAAHSAEQQDLLTGFRTASDKAP